MMRVKKGISLGLLFFTMVVAAAIYGPFRCDNGCNAQDMTDGFTSAFIRGTVNRILQDDAARSGKNHVWRPGDEVTICDGKWCVTSKYHPLTGLFIWNPNSRPAYRDDGSATRTELHPVFLESLNNPALYGLIARMATMCLQGRLNYGGGSFEGGDSYSYDGTYLTVTSSYREFSLGGSFCNL